MFLNASFDIKNMILPIIIAIIILAIIIFTIIKTIQNLIVGVSLIAIILVAAYLLLGYVPSLKGIPIIGPYIPSMPTIADMITWIKRYFRNVEINEVSRDSENNLLIIITNTGKFQVSNISVFVDNKSVNIINEPKDPLKYGETTSIQTDWDEDFSEIIVQTSKFNVSYSK
jgi:hypothetical protein